MRDRRRALALLAGGLAAAAALAAGGTAVAGTTTPSPAPSSAASPAAGGSAADPAQDDTAGAEAPGTYSPELSQRLADLVSGEDERLVDIKVAVGSLGTAAPKVPYRVRSAGGYTLVLTARRSPYTLEDLRRLAPQTFVRLEDGSYLLREHVLVDAGATLTIEGRAATTIRLASNGRGFVSIVNDGGRLRLLGRASAPVTITSWDETLRADDTKPDDGRAYVRSRGQLVVRHATVKDLGFWSGRTGGLSVSFPDKPQTGADLGVAEATTRTKGSTSTNRLTTVLPSGGLPADDAALEAVGAEVSDTTIDGNAFGLFVSAASGVKLTDVTIRRSTVSGLVLHRSVTSAQVQQVRVEGSALDGVVVTKGVEGTTLSQVESSRNGRDGIRVDGTPLASGPSASGQSTRSFGGNVVAASTVAANGRTGIRVVGGTNVRVITNSVTGGPQGIVVDEGADGVVVEGNRVGDASANGIHVRASRRVEVRGNAVDGAPTGIRVSDAAAEVLSNSVTGATLHAVTLVGAVRGTSVSGNTLSGAGTSAVDVVRALPDARPAVGDNDDAGWAVTLTKDSLLSTVMHPMTLLWIAIGAVMLLTLPLGKRRTGMPTPYPTGPASPASIQDIEALQLKALVAAGVVAPPDAGRRPAARDPWASPTVPPPLARPDNRPVPVGVPMVPLLVGFSEREERHRRAAAPTQAVPLPAPHPAAQPMGHPAAQPVPQTTARPGPPASTRSPLHPDYPATTRQPSPARTGTEVHPVGGPADGWAAGTEHRVVDLSTVERELAERELAEPAAGGDLAHWIRGLETKG